VDFLNVNKSEHEEVGHGSDLETVVSQWENLGMGPLMAHWKGIDLNINNMQLTHILSKGPIGICHSYI
jgi:hypothetical protein